MPAAGPATAKGSVPLLFRYSFLVESLPKSNGHPSGESDIESIWQVF